MNIPLCVSRAITKEDVLYAVEAIAESSSGVRCRIEHELTELVGVSQARVTDSVASALRNLLFSWSVCKGEAVFVPSFADSYIVNIVTECGAVPIFVDCDRDTWLMNADKLESAVEKCIKKDELYPRAVIVSDIFGMPFDGMKINSICAKYGLLLIEDASHALGAKASERKAGTLGDASVVGFGGVLGINACNEGGAVLTNDAQQSKVLKLIADGGEKTVDSATGAVETVCKGSRSYMDEVTAGMLVSRLAQIEEKTAKRRANAEKLRAAAMGTAVKFQHEAEGIQGAYPVFALCAENQESAERMVKEFRKAEIGCRAIYSKPLCRSGAFKELGCQVSDVPVGSNLSVCTFVLPCHEELTEKQVDYICEMIKVICV